MRRVIRLLLLGTVVLAGQDAQTHPDLLQMSDRLQRAIDMGDWKEAATLSTELRSAVIAARDSTLASGSNEQIDRVVSWLPTNTETIVVAQQPFTLTEGDPHTNPSGLDAARGYVLGLLDTPGDGSFSKVMDGSTIRFAVLAARKFREHPPDGSEAAPLGMIAYEGCAVYGFGKAMADETFTKAREEAIAGHRSWLAEGKQYEQGRGATPRTDTFFLTLLKPDLLLACNNREFFSSVLARISSPAEDHVLRDRPEWKYVDRLAPLWAFRHYLPDGADEDPTRPGADWIGVDDATATGMVVHVGRQRGEIQALWLSSSPESPWKPLEEMPELRESEKAVRRPDGLWELTVEDQQYSGVASVFALMMYLGFAVLV